MQSPTQFCPINDENLTMGSRSYVKWLAIFFTLVACVLLFLLYASSSYKGHLSIGQSNGALGVKSWCPLPELPHHIEDGLDPSSSFNEKPQCSSKWKGFPQL